MVTLAGCGSSREAGVEDVATAFYSAVADGDGDAACGLLGPATRSELEQSAGKPCAQAVLEEDIPQVSAPVDVAVFGTAANVSFDADTTFLGEFGDEWLVVAAGCTATATGPHDCVVKGG